jgi:hypothetical protein
VVDREHARHLPGQPGRLSHVGSGVAAGLIV